MAEIDFEKIEEKVKQELLPRFEGNEMAPGFIGLVVHAARMIVEEYHIFNSDDETL